MLYRHEKTGAVIDVKSKMGGCWVPVEEPGTPPAAPKEDKPKQTRKKGQK